MPFSLMPNHVLIEFVPKTLLKMPFVLGLLINPLILLIIDLQIDHPISSLTMMLLGPLMTPKVLSGVGYYLIDFLGS